MRSAFVVPAFDAAATVASVVSGLRREAGPDVPIFVVNDGSRDATAREAESAGAIVVSHSVNRGKGAAIRTGLLAAKDAGCDVAVTVDADDQHPPAEAKRLLDAAVPADAIVLGTRDLRRAGAPLGSRVGNSASNFFVSLFTGRRFRDTQCGLRRYPVGATLSIRTRDQRFGFEAEVIFAARRAKITLVEVPVSVIYRRSRTTHYRAVWDTIRIIYRIVVTLIFPVRWVVASLFVVSLLYLIHPGIVLATRMLPPRVSIPADALAIDPQDPDLRWAGTDYARHRGKIWEVRLSGSPERLGEHQVALLRGEMMASEGELWKQLQQLVPAAWARAVIFDMARIRFRAIDRGMSDAHRREIAATAMALVSDPWGGEIPSYQRMVYLHALYDVSLSFENSPLLGCTSFALTAGAAEQGHTILARNFDFEAGNVFDEHKAVFLVREPDKLGYASVAWPGLIGTVTGMNEAGVALVVHGGRARGPSSEGEPLVHTMRDVLSLARSTEEAIALLAARKPMVSHIVMIADGAGHTAVVERAPGEPLFVRRGTDKLALTNHFEGPLAADPANQRVRKETTTVARRERLDELLSKLPAGAGVEGALAILRDKKGPAGAPLPAGDRRAIDASIATHGVVMDATARVMWVSEGPHLSGRFVRFDVGKLLLPGYDPRLDRDVAATSADAAVESTGLARH
jgi:isopenicillin-N N-acyltransferase-like protein